MGDFEGRVVLSGKLLKLKEKALVFQERRCLVAQERRRQERAGKKVWATCCLPYVEETQHRCPSILDWIMHSSPTFQEGEGATEEGITCMNEEEESDFERAAGAAAGPPKKKRKTASTSNASTAAAAAAAPARPPSSKKKAQNKKDKDGN